MERQALSAHISNPKKHHQATHQNDVNRRLRNAPTPGPSCSTPSLDSETADHAPKRLNSLQMWMSAPMCNPCAFTAYAQPREPASTRSSRCSSRRGISQAPSRSKLEATDTARGLLAVNDGTVNWEGLWLDRVCRRQRVLIQSPP